VVAHQRKKARPLARSPFHVGWRCAVLRQQESSRVCSAKMTSVLPGRRTPPLLAYLREHEHPQPGCIQGSCTIQLRLVQRKQTLGHKHPHHSSKAVGQYWCRENKKNPEAMRTRILQKNSTCLPVKLVESSMPRECSFGREGHTIHARVRVTYIFQSAVRERESLGVQH
jgi:hypothetical protein